MSSNDPLGFAVFGFVVGGLLFFGGFRLRQRYKVIETTPRSRVRSVAVGLVELEGQAQIEEQALLTPFSQLECVYYSYKVEERRKSGKRHRWVTIAEEQSEVPFRLQDETGSILVLPTGAHCTFETDQKFRMSFFSDAKEDQFKAGLDRIGISHSALFMERPLRCSETYILPGDHVFILGTATPRSFSVSSEVNQDNLYVGKGSANAPFILADRSERELLSSLWWQMCGMILAGPLLTVASLIYILHRFRYF